ncbi:MAG: alpha/beta fold hydrolase [Myxococcota bacterium]
MNTHSVALSPAQPIMPPWPGPALPPALVQLAARAHPESVARVLWRRWSGRGASGALAGFQKDSLARAEHIAVPFGEQSLCAYRWRGTGPRVLMVHGWTGRAATMAALQPTLALEYMDVVAFDAPGCGDSPGRRGSMASFVDSVAAVDRRLGGFDIVVAQGAGAPAALAALGSGRAHRWALLGPADAPRVVASWCQHLAGQRGRDLFGAFDELVLRRLGVSTDHYGLDRLASNAAGRLLVAHDPDDQAVPFAHAQELASMWPGATLVPVQGAGHRGLVHDVGVHVALLEYLRSL